MKQYLPTRRSLVTGVTLTVLTLVVGGGALLGADQGAPGWIQVPLLTWLTTFGLPTTAGVLAVAWVWGSAGPLFGLGNYAVFAVLTGGALQVAAAAFLQPRGRNARCH